MRGKRVKQLRKIAFKEYQTTFNAEYQKLFRFKSFFKQIKRKYNAQRDISRAFIPEIA